MREGGQETATDCSPATYRWLLAVAFLGGLWLTHRGFLARTPAGADVMAHVARTDAGMHLLTSGRTDGWFPVFGSGYRLYAVYGPGLTLASAAVRVASLGVIHPARSFAVLGSLSIALLPPTMAVLCRELGLTRRAALIAGTLTLYVGAQVGGGVAGLYTVGLVPQAVAMPAQLLVLAGLVRAFRTGSPRIVAATALGVGWLLILHPISLVVLVFIAPGLLLTVRRPWSAANAAKAAGALLWGAAVAAFWLIPAIQHRALRGPLSAFDTPSLLGRLREVAAGDALYPPVLAGAVALGLALALGQATRPGARRQWLAAPATAVAFLVLGHVAVGLGWEPAELWVQLPNRGLALAGCLLLIPLAVLSADALGRLRPGVAGRATAATVAALAVLAPVILTGPLDPPQSARAPSADLQAVARLLKADALAPARHLLVEPSPFVPLGTAEPSRWLASASGSNTAQLYFAEATRNPGAGDLPGRVLNGLSPADALGPLRRAGISHLVVTAPIPAEQLDGQPGYRLIETDGTLAVYAIEPERGAPDPRDLLQPAANEGGGPNATLEAVLEPSGEDAFRWSATATPGTTVVAPVAYDPDWTARVDGKPVEVTRSDEGLVQFPIPSGHHDVELRFAGGRNPWGAIAVSAVAGLAALAVLLRGAVLRGRLRRRDRPPRPDPGAGTIAAMGDQPTGA